MGRDTGLERKGPGLMPHSGVALIYKGHVPVLNGRRLNLTWVVLEQKGLELGSFSLVCLAPLYNTSWSYLNREVQSEDESNTRCALNLFCQLGNVDSVIGRSIIQASKMVVREHTGFWHKSC